MKIKAEKIKAKDLEPGDLFSTADQAYWDMAMVGNSIGESVYIRTNFPSDYADDADTYIYKITIIKEAATPTFAYDDRCGNG